MAARGSRFAGSARGYRCPRTTPRRCIMATTSHTGGKSARKRGSSGTGTAQVPKLREANSGRGKPAFTKAYGFGLVTGALFLLSWTGQFVMQLITVRNESAEHGQPFEWGE